MFCENCGNRLSDTAKFCAKCGCKVITDDPIISSNQESCSGGDWQNTNNQSYNYSDNNGMHVEPPSLIIQGDGQVFYVETNNNPKHFNNPAELNNYIRINDNIGDNMLWDIYLPGEPEFMKKILNVQRTFAALEQGEFPVLLLDMTAFGSAKEGMLITNRYVYYRYLVDDPSFMKVPLDSIFGVGYSNYSNNVYFFFSDNMYMCPSVSLHDGKSYTVATQLADIISIARKLR